MRIAAVIVAAGRGTRAGGPVAKQWQKLNGRPVADWTVDAFRALPEISQIVLVLPAGDMARAGPYAGVIAVPGGAHRAGSVAAGLEALAARGGTDAVLIHDVARPLVSQDVILSVIAALRDAPGAAPGLPVTDALWRGADGQVSGTADRDGLYRAQTPQGFHFGAILAAHRRFAGAQAAAMADDVELARAAGIDVAIVPGDEDNLKITRAEDFARAEKLMRGSMDIRVGNGFDVHRFGPGDHVVLCGVTVPHEAGLVGHSDADVGMHAVTDAIYGALAAGDIGQHFPPSDPQWKGVASRVFLEHAVDLAAERGYLLSGIDLTLICEHPKIGPHALAMKKKLAAVTGFGVDRIGVKATTTEGLGFAGRGEGIAALATVTLVSA